MKHSIKKPLTLRKSRLAPSAAALTIGLPTLLVGAIQSASAEDAIVLDAMQVEERTVDTNPYAEAGAPYKAKVSGDSRHVKDLADTPQTITVLTQTQIKESGRSDLKDIVDAQPGITLGTGENGNAFGDRYVIRGHEARSDVFVDGFDPVARSAGDYAAQPAAFAPVVVGAAADTIDLLVQASTTAPVSGEVRIFAVLLDVSDMVAPTIATRD